MVDRRLMGDWVPEDDILKKAGLNVRENCLQLWTPDQERAMKEYMR
jgi:hypothetical protein